MGPDRGTERDRNAEPGMRPLSHSEFAPLLSVLLLLLALAGCDRGPARSSGPEVRDSAGIRIVWNVGYRWPEGSGWRLSHEPLLDIGVLEDDPRYQFYQVVGAQQLSDGRIVVANSGTSELRFYDSAGRFLSASGRQGGGPGEFGGLRSLAVLSGDSLLT